MDKTIDIKDIGIAKELMIELFSVVFSSASSYKYIIRVTEDKFRIVGINDTFQENAGITNAMVTGKSPHEVFDRDTADSFCKHYQECVNKKKPINYRETISLPGGEKHFITFLTPVIQNDRVEYLFGESIDSTLYLKEVKKNRDYQEMITGQVSLLQILFSISMGFTKSTYGDFEKQVDLSLAQLGDILRCDLISIFKFYEDEEYARRIKRWKNPEADQKTGPAYDYFDEELASIISNNRSRVKGINDNSVKDYVKLYRKEGLAASEKDKLNSVISLPVVYNNEIWGYITYYHINEQKEWNEHEIEALMLFGDIFINTFFRVEAERQLRILSEKDGLTGLDNRVSMKRNLELFASADYLPFGFVFMDVNGLKMTNDCFGHNVGDDLLVTTADLLKEIAADYYPARMGGDEFALLCPRCNEETIIDMLASIKEKCKNADNLPIPLSISAGYAIRNDIEMPVSQVVEKAEIDMYRHKTLESKAVKDEIMEYFLLKMESEEVFSPDHHQKVISLAGKLGERLQLREIESEKLQKSLQFYDIGYVPICDRANPKARIFSPDQEQPLQNHCETGYYIAMAMPFLQPIAEIILSHHENWDGSGYPQGLKGQEIPFISRIISLVEAYVTMTGSKTGERCLSKKEAMREIEKKSGVLFDPKITKVFLELLRDKNL